MGEIVDTHAHIYHPDEQAYPMISRPHRPPEGLGTIEHLRREAEANGVGKVVLVQTGSAYRWDNRLLGDTAKGNGDWAVGVCTLDPASEESVGELERLVAGYNVKGVRVEATPRGFQHEGSERLWETVRSLGAVVCAHVRGEYLGELANLLRRYPEVSVVLDHCAYPDAEAGEKGDVMEKVCGLAEFVQLRVKLTFGVTSSRQEYPFEDTWPLLKRVIAAFGPERCMWGSDFPCEHWLKKASYGQHLELFQRELGLSRWEKEAILDLCPMRLWFDGD